MPAGFSAPQAPQVRPETSSLPDDACGSAACVLISLLRVGVSGSALSDEAMVQSWGTGPPTAGDSTGCASARWAVYTAGSVNTLGQRGQLREKPSAEAIIAPQWRQKRVC